MKTYYTVGLSMLAGIGVGAVAVQTLHAQAKPPVYFIAEIDVTNVEGYVKEYAPKAQAILKAGGGKLLAAGQKVTGLEGDPPKPRVALWQFESMDQIQAWRNSAEFKEHRIVGDKYAKFRTFTIEAMPQ